MLESVGFEFGFMTGLKSRGPKPLRMAQVLPELHALAQHLRVQKCPPLERNTVQGHSGTPNANLGGGGMVGVRLSGNSTPIPCRAALDTQTQLSGAPYKNYTRYDAACRCLEGACSVLGVVRLKGNVLGLDNLTTGDIPAVDAMFISMSKENRLILPRIRSEIRG